MYCVLCESEIVPDPISGWRRGHNAEPLAAWRCCDNCNGYVIGERIRRFYKTEELTHATD